MAEYTNLTSLEGLAVGDVITYDTTTAIKLKSGLKVSIEIYGQMTQYIDGSTVYKSAKGGKVSFNFVSNTDRDVTFFNINIAADASTQYDLSQYQHCDLLLGDWSYIDSTNYGDYSADILNNRIAVAGNAGNPAAYTTLLNDNSVLKGGLGGGLTGGNGNVNNNGTTPKGLGGSQTSGGAAGTASYNKTASPGVFGYGGERYGSSKPYMSGSGGYGWYGGGGGCKSSSGTSYYASGGGGSGFIIGTSTTTYPAGYLGDDTTLQNTIASSISDGVLTQGGSSETTPKMILTIVEIGSGGSSQSIISYFNGTDFVNTNAKYYNGSEFIDCDAYYYDGTEFKKI